MNNQQIDEYTIPGMLLAILISGFAWFNAIMAWRLLFG